MVYVKHLFSFRESGICVPGRGCLHDQLPKPWALSFERAPSMTTASPKSCHNLLRRNLVQPVWLHWESILWNLHLVSPRLCPTCLFPLLIGFCAICSKQSHEYDYMLSLKSSPSKSPNLGVILDNFNTAPYSLLLKICSVSDICWVFTMCPSIF